MPVGVGVGEDVGDLLAVRQRLHVGLTVGERVAVGARRLGDQQRTVGADLGESRTVVGCAAQRRYGVSVICIDVGVVAQHVAADRVRLRVLRHRGHVRHRHRRVVGAIERDGEGPRGGWERAVRHSDREVFARARRQRVDRRVGRNEGVGSR